MPHSCDFLSPERIESARLVIEREPDAVFTFDAQAWTMALDEVERLRAALEALRNAERVLMASPLVKSYKRELEALEIIRAALASGAMSGEE